MSSPQNLSTNSRLMQQFTRPLVVGALSYASAMILLGSDNGSVKLPVVSMDVSVSAYFGLLGFGSSFVTEIAANWIIPYIPQSSSNATYEVALVRPAVHSAVAYGVTRMLYPGFADDFGIAKIAGAAFVAELGADYAYNNFLLHML